MCVRIGVRSPDANDGTMQLVMQQVSGKNALGTLPALKSLSKLQTSLAKKEHPKSGAWTNISKG